MSDGHEVALIERLQAECGLDDVSAHRALGALVIAVRMCVVPDPFPQLREAFPDVDGWLQSASGGGAQTGEMVVLLGPEALEGNLHSAGVEEAHLRLFCAIVRAELEARLDPELADAIVEKIELMQ